MARKKLTGKVTIIEPSKPLNKSSESMILQHELIDNQRQIKLLNKRNRTIRKLLKATGQPMIRSQYFDIPILLYALRLEKDHWYIGMTRNVDRRLKRHNRGKGSIWTKEYKVIELSETRETDTDDDSVAGQMEDDMTIEYAMKYGSQFVHGGGYCQRKPRWPDVVVQNEYYS